MNPKQSKALTGLAIFVVLATFCHIIETKSLGQQAPRRLNLFPGSKDQRDPIVAIPSDQYEQASSQPAAEPQYQQVQYIVQHQPSGVQQYQPQEQPQYQTVAVPATNAAPQPQPEATYYVVKHEPQVVTANGEPHQHDANCNHNQEYMTLSSLPSAASQSEGTTNEASNGKREYPGEILYIGQDGDSAIVKDSGASSAAEMISQNPGAAATILTEIPIKDMPYDVLEKLKKDYGVKVVATRERPGANLVINCDDYASQDNNICAKPQTFSTNQGNSPYALVASSGPNVEEYHHHHHHHHEHSAEAAHEHPEHLPELSPADHHHHHESEHSYESEGAEPRPGMYVTRDGETRVAGEHSSPSNERDQDPHHRESFGSRQVEAEEHLEKHDESGAQPESNRPSHAEPLVDQPESDSHQAGFDAPSATSVDEEAAKSSQAGSYGPNQNQQ